ncbi:hypothetical protein H0H93_006301 [Arthromyces matolae]|nr:hypothetical protein H0H93_006301 [Arthromyces matolae]
MANLITSTKLRIPHPDEPECEIVGILEQHCPSTSTEGRKLALKILGNFSFAPAPSKH